MALVLPMLIAASAAAQQPPPADPPAEGPDSEIVITGERSPRNPGGVAERPFSEIERAPLGSRIARRVRERPFRSVATESGLAGMLGSSGAGNWDGTGGSGHGVRSRRVTECVAEHDRVSEEVACLLYRARAEIETGDHAAAEATLRPLLERRGLRRIENYYVGYHAYLLAEARRDDQGMGRALTTMLSSGEMLAEDRPRALRMLARIALRGGDETGAIARLEEAAAAGAHDAHILANLAALYSRQGRAEEARLRLSEAVALVRRDGGTPPAEWTEFLSQPR